jgi:hypothetical protein
MEELTRPGGMSSGEQENLRRSIAVLTVEVQALRNTLLDPQYGLIALQRQEIQHLKGCVDQVESRLRHVEIRTAGAALVGGGMVAGVLRVLGLL